ncbi:MAG: alpha-D-ribose 1-methylphosphonate 5-triphosphate diphosphatase, partial [Acetobacteraceae bacterium]
MTAETVLTNALLVLPQEMMPGTLKLHDGRITAVDAGRSALPSAIDLEGDLLIPGAVDLHSDNLERQVHPRSTARWPSREAMIAHDAQCAAAGVTTVLDALCVGDLGYQKDRNRTFLEGVADLDALEGAGLLRVEHFLHLRCEVPAPDTLDLLEPASGHARVRMASLMDHSPGVGQYADLDRYRVMRRRDGDDEATIERRIVEMLDRRAALRDPNRRALLDRLRRVAV